MEKNDSQYTLEWVNVVERDVDKITKQLEQLKWRLLEWKGVLTDMPPPPNPDPDLD